MQINIITLFPEMFKTPFSESIIGRAQTKKIVDIQTHNLRDFSTDKHHKVDDRPYGGGPGMILKPEPIYKAIQYILKSRNIKKKMLK